MIRWVKYLAIMTKKTKRALFYTAVVVFLFVSYVVVLYAQGYKYNFSKWEFERTGSVYVKANVGADVYLDGEKNGSTSFLGNSHTISGLLPGEYSVRLARDDQYSSWEKRFEVEEGFVNEFSKIVLFPTSGEGKVALEAELETMLYPPVPTPSATASGPSASPTATPKPTPKTAPSPSATPNPKPYYLLSKILYKNNGSENDPIQLAINVEGFSLSSNESKLVYWSGKELWVVWLKDSNYQPNHKSGDRERIIRLARSVLKAVWYKDEDWLIVDDGKNYKLIETDTRGGVNLVEF
ncbi:MAG: hypothetical protein WD989_00425 [Candidatus Paceibacterota bacterium]